MAHTPGPWAVAWDNSIVPLAHKDRKIGAAYDADIDRERYAQIICLVQQDRHGRGDSEGNAALVVRAVNAHEAMLGALKTLVDYDGGGELRSYEVLIESARAAIKLAESGT